MIYASKNEAVGHYVQTHLGNCLLARVTNNFQGGFSRFMRTKTMLFAVKFRRILEVFYTQALQKN